MSRCLGSTGGHTSESPAWFETTACCFQTEMKIQVKNNAQEQIKSNNKLTLRPAGRHVAAAASH